MQQNTDIQRCAAKYRYSMMCSKIPIFNDIHREHYTITSLPFLRNDKQIKSRRRSRRDFICLSFLKNGRDVMVTYKIKLIVTVNDKLSISYNSTTWALVTLCDS